MYASQFFKALGVNVGHEWGGKQGVVGYTTIFTFRPAAFENVWLMVRNPLGVVGSTTAFNYIETAGYFVLPPDTEPIRRGLAYWVHWNLLCETVARWTFRVEDLWPGTETYDRIRFELQVPVRRPDPELPNTVNSRVHDAVTWAQLDEADAKLAAMAREMARRYGYATEDV